MRRKYSVMHYGKGKSRITLLLERKVWKNGFAGLVLSDRLEDSIVLAVDNRRLDENCLRRIYITAQKDGSKPVIVLSTAAFVGLKRGYDINRCALLHEVGHYCCGHLVNPPLLEEEVERRSKLVAQNKVAEEELAADAFAAEYLGAEYVAWALQECMDQWFAEQLCEDVPDDGQVLREYKMRINHLSRQFGLDEEDEEED